MLVNNIDVLVITSKGDLLGTGGALRRCELKVGCSRMVERVWEGGKDSVHHKNRMTKRSISKFNLLINILLFLFL